MSLTETLPSLRWASISRSSNANFFAPVSSGWLLVLSADSWIFLYKLGQTTYITVPSLRLATSFSAVWPPPWRSGWCPGSWPASARGAAGRRRCLTTARETSLCGTRCQLSPPRPQHAAQYLMSYVSLFPSLSNLHCCQYQVRILTEPEHTEWSCRPEPRRPDPSLSHRWCRGSSARRLK